MDQDNNNQSPAPEVNSAPVPEVQQPAPVQPVAAPAPVSAENPGKTMGIVGLILSFLMPLVGLIISIIALRKSKKAGMSNGLAVAGIVLGAIGIVFQLIMFSIFGVAILAVLQKCAELGPGTHYVDGTTFTCN